MIIKKVLVKIKYHLTELQEKLQNYIDWKLLNFKLNLKNDTWYFLENLFAEHSIKYEKLDFYFLTI